MLVMHIPLVLAHVLAMLPKFMRRELHEDSKYIQQWSSHQMLDREEFRTACGIRTIHYIQKYLKDNNYVHNPNQKIESQGVIQYTTEIGIGVRIYQWVFNICIIETECLCRPTTTIDPFPTMPGYCMVCTMSSGGLPWTTVDTLHWLHQAVHRCTLHSFILYTLLYIWCYLFIAFHLYPCCTMLNWSA